MNIKTLPLFALLLFSFCLISCREDDVFQEPTADDYYVSYNHAFGTIMDMDKIENEVYSSTTTPLSVDLNTYCIDNGHDPSKIKEVSISLLDMYEVSQNNPDQISNLDLNDEVKVYLTKTGLPDLLIGNATAPFDDTRSSLNLEDVDVKEYLMQDPIRYKIEYLYNKRLEYYNTIGYTATYRVLIDI